MRIVVNDIAASTGGALTILKQFYEYVATHNAANDEWIFILGGDYLPESSNIKIVQLPNVKKSHLKKLIFDNISGAKFIQKLHPDVVLSLQNIITFGVKVPQFTYIHQAIPFQSEKKFSLLKKEERKFAYYQYVVGYFIKRSAKKANGIIVQTDAMKKAVGAKVGVKPEKILTAMPDFPLMPKADQSWEREDNLFFYPTSAELYKNTGLIVKACDILNKNGITDFRVLLTLPEGTITHPNILCVGYLNKEEMAEKYQQATLIFPSYIETVGLPLLEASFYGGRILASDCPFSKEVLEGYPNVSYFPPFDEIKLAEDMRQVMEHRLPISPVLKKGARPSSWGEVVAFIKNEMT